MKTVVSTAASINIRVIASHLANDSHTSRDEAAKILRSFRRGEWPEGFFADHEFLAAMGECLESINGATEDSQGYYQPTYNLYAAIYKFAGKTFAHCHNNGDMSETEEVEEGTTIQSYLGNWESDWHYAFAKEGLMSLDITVSANDLAAAKDSIEDGEKCVVLLNGDIEAEDENDWEQRPCLRFTIDHDADDLGISTGTNMIDCTVNTPES